LLAALAHRWLLPVRSLDRAAHKTPVATAV